VNGNGENEDGEEEWSRTGWKGGHVVLPVSVGQTTLNRVGFFPWQKYFCQDDGTNWLKLWHLYFISSISYYTSILCISSCVI